MSARILSALGILSSEVPVGNLLWVDAVNGVDALAVRGRMTIPFKTLTAAKNAAITPANASDPRDTIVVLPGLYSEANLLKNRVNWLFLPGARVETAAGAIFDTSVNGTNAAVDSSVAGWGEFRATNASNGYVIYSAVAGSNLAIEGRSMSSVDGCIVVSAASGTLRVHSTEIVSATYGIYIAGTATDNHVVADSIQASGNVALEVELGGIHVSARRIACTTSAPAVEVVGGSGTTVIDAREIVSGLSVGIRYSTTAAVLRVINARIIAGGTTSQEGRAVDIDVNPGPTTSLIRLDGCTLIAASAGDNSIRSASASATIVQGSVVANKSYHGTSITFRGHWYDHTDIK